MGRLTKKTAAIEDALNKAESAVQPDELIPRNVGAVDPSGEVDDTISFATTEYVDTAITSAITTTLNTPV